MLLRRGLNPGSILWEATWLLELQRYQIGNHSSEDTFSGSKIDEKNGWAYWPGILVVFLLPADQADRSTSILPGLNEVWNHLDNQPIIFIPPQTIVKKKGDREGPAKDCLRGEWKEFWCST